MKWQMMFDQVSTEGDIKQKVEKKFSGLETYVGSLRSKLQTGFVWLSRGDRFGYKVKVGLHLPGKEVMAEGKGETLLTAIDETYARAAREIKSYLSRIRPGRK